MTRTTPPPNVITKCVSDASRSTRAWWADAWIVSSSHFCTEMTVRSDPSRAMISTFCAYWALPVCCSTTVPFDIGSASITRWPSARLSAPWPTMSTTMGSATSASRGSLMCSASVAPCQATAAVMSSGTKNSPRGESPAASPAARNSAPDVNVYVTPSLSVDCANSGASRETGVCFQLTSRPVGVPNSFGSNDRGRSERVCTGTVTSSCGATSARAGSMWPC